MLTAQQLDRAIGAVVASAVGDALGASYEFQPPVAAPARIEYRASALFTPGEWTDDTSMAVPILQAVAAGGRLDDPRVLATIVGEWIGWAREAKGAGTQTLAVLSGIRHVTEDDARQSARAVHEETGHSAGNGSLMRAAPVVLGYLADPDGGGGAAATGAGATGVDVVEDADADADANANIDARAALAAAARRVSELTHYETDAGDACVVWSLAVRSAILTGRPELRAAIDALPVDRAAVWHERIDAAEAALPWELTDNNAWVVGALEAAWSAITHSASLADAVTLAVRSGNDTDTVAAIAGALAGAMYGASALPSEWVEPLHGWPGDEFRIFGAAELIDLARRAATNAG